MSPYARRRRHSNATVRPFIAFLLVASFGILFVGCGGEPQDIPQADKFTFTAQDIARVRELIGSNTGSFVPHLEFGEGGETGAEVPVINVQEVENHNAIRQQGDSGEDLFRVTNIFLNVRSEPRVTSNLVEQLDQGDTVSVIEFVSASWARVSLSREREGYVASRYISKIVSEEQLAEERKKYEGLYFVDFGFLNVRKEADSGSEKIGELPGQTFVRPLSQDEVWARIAFEGGEGYVAVQYLSSFLPNFLVRQSAFELPVLQYRLTQENVLDNLVEHVDALQNAGYRFITLRDFYDLLTVQEQRDVRLDPKSIVLGITDITPQNIGEVSEVLRASRVSATLFLQTQHLGSNGIDNKAVLTLLANGHDLQSNGHTGDDLRSLTNAQVDLELRQSKKLIAQYTKQPVFAVAYPMGGVNDRVARKAAEAGYLLGLGNAPDSTFERSQFLRAPSYVMRSGMTVEEVLETINN